MNAFAGRMRDALTGRDDDAFAFEEFVLDPSGRSAIASSALLLTICAFLAIALTWAWFTELDEVTRGAGRSAHGARRRPHGR